MDARMGALVCGCWLQKQSPPRLLVAGLGMMDAGTGFEPVTFRL